MYCWPSWFWEMSITNLTFLTNFLAILVVIYIQNIANALIIFSYPFFNIVQEFSIIFLFLFKCAVLGKKHFRVFNLRWLVTYKCIQDSKSFTTVTAATNYDNSLPTFLVHALFSTIFQKVIPPLQRLIQKMHCKKFNLTPVP